MENTDLKKNAENYVDPTAAATLSKPEPGDIWTYDDGVCLIIKNHGHFSTCLLLVDNTGMNPSDIRIETTRGEKWTDPRRLTYGKNYKMRRYIETIDLDAFEYILGVVSGELGVELPCKKNTLQDLSEFEADVQKLTEERDAIREHNKHIQRQNDTLRDQLDRMTELHAKAVDRVNNVNFEKIKVVTQLELLQFTVANVLDRFQQKTEG